MLVRHPDFRLQGWFAVKYCYRSALCICLQQQKIRVAYALRTFMQTNISRWGGSPALKFEFHLRKETKHSPTSVCFFKCLQKGLMTKRLNSSVPTEAAAALETTHIWSVSRVGLHTDQHKGKCTCKQSMVIFCPE